MKLHAFFGAAVASAAAAAQSSAPICEDSIDGKPPFNMNDSPCLLGCGTPLAVATGSLLPGSVNASAIPYCQLDCVHTPTTPQQSSAAPACHGRCAQKNSGSPENEGWCMYWCVDGYGDLVASEACVPSLIMEPVGTTVIENGEETLTNYALTQPAAWGSWYLTQTVISRTGGQPPPDAGVASGTGDLWGWATSDPSASDRRHLFGSSTQAAAITAAPSLSPGAVLTSSTSQGSQTAAPTTSGGNRGRIALGNAVLYALGTCVLAV